MENKQRSFDNWPAPRGSLTCPPESTLADWIMDSETPEAQAHLPECETCRLTVEHARKAASEADGNLRTFMLNVRMQAQREAEKHSSPWRILVNYVFASRAQTVGAVAAVATVALIATSGLWRQLGFLQSPQPVQTIVMDRDVNGELYRQALTELRDSYSAISRGSGSKTSTVTQIDQLNQVLSKVDKSRLQPEQRQQLEVLQSEYQALVFDRLQPSLSSSPGGTKAQNLQTDFFSTYASYLAKGGEQLTVSPEVSVKSSGTKMYVIAHSDVSYGRRTAADFAVRDLQNRVPDFSLEYKPAPIPSAAAAQASPASHPD
jgi:hypothetical protein